MAAKRTTIKGRGRRKGVSFKRGALHRQLNVPQGKKIPASKMRAAKAGRYGKLAAKRARFATGMLAKGRRTAARRRRK